MEGDDAYDAPMETAGAFTREGSSQTTTMVWNGTEYVEVKMDSFNVSLVSNLGSENALSNIAISYNNVNYRNVFSAESNYSSAQGGSATASVTFYDSLGNPRTATLRVSLVCEDSNSSTWRWYADCADDIQA